MSPWYLSYGGDPLGPFDHDQAMAPIIQMDIQQAGGIKTALFGGEGSLLGALGGLIDGDNR